MNLQTMRRTSQTIILAVTLLGLAGITTTGLIYPYFFCYSCPWDVGSCPLGIMEHGFIDIQITFMTGLSLLLYLFGFLSLMAVIFGKAFCGWACPIGTLQDITRKLGISKKANDKLRPDVDPRWKHMKFLMLLAVPFTAFVSGELFYTALCPIGGITGTIPSLAFYSSDWLLGSGFPVKLTSMILFTILIILVTRGWCKYLCPIGGFLAPWNWISLLGLRRNEETCRHCNLCDKACPMDIKDIGTKPEAECILCGRCVSNCNFNSLDLGFRWFKDKRMAAVWIVLLLASASMLAGGVYFGGYEKTDEINSLPCLGCLALDSAAPDIWFSADPGAQPDYVLAGLSRGPVFLHYRTDVCSACDEMEPHIDILEEEYGYEVQFIHINLDHATSEEYDSYDIYDVKGTPETRWGVPMFTTIYYGQNGTDTGIFYKTSYSSSSDQGLTKRFELMAIMNESLENHVPYPDFSASGDDGLSMTVDEPMKPAIPDGSVNFSFTLRNHMDSDVDALISLEKPSNWDGAIYPSNPTVQAGGSEIIILSLQGNGTAPDDPVAEFMLTAVDQSNSSNRVSSLVQVPVRDEIIPPEILSMDFQPPEPVMADHEITITVEVDDNTQVSSVRLHYFSCTPLTCSLTQIVEMNASSGGGHSVTVAPVGQDHTEFHYHIVVEDVHGNTAESQAHVIELEPVDGDSPAAPDIETETRPKWMGVVLLSAMAVAAIVIVLRSRKGPGKPGVKEERGDNAAKKERIKKAYDEGRLSQEQYKHDTEKFKD